MFSTLFIVLGDFTISMNETKTYDQYGFVLSDNKLFRHHHYEDLVKYLHFYGSTYPDITRLHSVGKSVDGRDLMVLVNSSTPNKHMPDRTIPRSVR